MPTKASTAESHEKTSPKICRGEFDPRGTKCSLVAVARRLRSAMRAKPSQPVQAFFRLSALDLPLRLSATRS